MPCYSVPALLRAIEEAAPRSFRDGFEMCSYIKTRAAELTRQDDKQAFYPDNSGQPAWLGKDGKIYPRG